MATKPDPYTPERKRARILCDTVGCTLSVHVRGEIDHHTAGEIRRGIDGMLFEKRPKKLVLDLSAVSFMDSSGLGLIMGRYSVMKELEGEMVVWNPSPETRSILTLAGMERMVRIEYPPGEAPAEGRAPSGRAGSRRPSVGQAPAGTSPRKKKKAPAGGVSASSGREATALRGRKEKEA